MVQDRKKIERPQQEQGDFWHVCAVAAIIIFAANIIFTHVFLPIVHEGMDYHDFYPIIAASQILQERGNPYTHGAVGDKIQTFRPGHPVASGYLYPTFWGHVVTPLASLPPKTAQRIWHGLNAVFFTLIIGASIRMLVPADQRIYSWAFLLGIFSFFQPAYETMYVGQVNLFVMLMIVLGIYYFTRGRPWVAGGLLAVGAMVKLWPLVVLYYFLLRRQWRVLAASFAMAAAIIAGSFVLTPPAVQMDYFTERLPKTVFEGNTKPVSSIHNVSLRGFMHRVFTTEAADAQARGMPMKFMTQNIAAINPNIITALFLGMAIFSLAAISWISYLPVSRKNASGSERLVVDVSLFILFLAIFSSFFTEHYLVLLMLPFIALFSSPRLRAILYERKVLLALSALSFFLTGVIHHGSAAYYRLWPDMRVGALFLQPQVYGLLLLFGVLIALSLHLRRNSQGS